MNLNFDLDEQEEGEKEDNSVQKNIVYYDTPANVRKITFVLSNSEQYTFDYADLSKTHYAPEEGMITMFFGADKVVMKGEKMDILLEKFELNLPKTITCINKRYVLLQQIDIELVNEITIN